MESSFRSYLGTTGNIFEYCSYDVCSLKKSCYRSRLMFYLFEHVIVGMKIDES